MECMCLNLPVSFSFPLTAAFSALRASSMVKHEDELSDGVAQLILMLHRRSRRRRPGKGSWGITCAGLRPLNSCFL